MTKKWSEKGVLAPLFDRLSDEDLTAPEEHPPFVTYTQAETTASIQRECQMILNTRCKLTREDYEDLEPLAPRFRFPSFFGLPDSTVLNPKNQSDAHELERIMANAIEIFESRLQNVQVTLEHYEESTQTLGLTVQGDLVIGQVQSPISFPLAFENFQEQGQREKEAYETRPRIVLNKNEQ